MLDAPAVKARAVARYGGGSVPVLVITTDPESRGGERGHGGGKAWRCRLSRRRVGSWRRRGCGAGGDAGYLVQVPQQAVACMWSMNWRRGIRIRAGREHGLAWRALTMGAMRRHTLRRGGGGGGNGGDQPQARVIQGCRWGVLSQEASDAGSDEVTQTHLHVVSFRRSTRSKA